MSSKKVGSGLGWGCGFGVGLGQGEVVFCYNVWRSVLVFWFVWSIWWLGRWWYG